jgi:hypothetical protein
LTAKFSEVPYVTREPLIHALKNGLMAPGGIKAVYEFFRELKNFSRQWTDPVLVSALRMFRIVHDWD